MLTWVIAAGLLAVVYELHQLSKRVGFIHSRMLERDTAARRERRGNGQGSVDDPVEP
jgi:hypothetical protein